MDFEEMKSRVYIVVDDEQRVIQIEGEYSLSNIANLDEAILIEEGEPCDRLNHAQVQYLDKPLRTMDGICRYKLVKEVYADCVETEDGDELETEYIDYDIVERTESEIESDRAKLPKPMPTDADRIRQLTAQVELAQEQITFLEDCLLEMADEVYS